MTYRVKCILLIRREVKAELRREKGNLDKKAESEIIVVKVDIFAE
jgi:hypothetical protein